MKTLKQIADEIGIPKQRLYRFVKSENIIEAHHEAHQSASVKYYDETAEAYMKSHFAAAAHHDEAHHDADGEAVHDAVLMQYEAVVKQCDALQKQLEDVTNDRETLIQQLNRIRADLAAVTNERDDLRGVLDAERIAHKEEADHLRDELARISSEHAERLATITERLATLTDQAQRLQAQQMQQPPMIADQQTQEKPPTFWQRLFKRSKE